MSDTDSFVDEVNEELRRDRFYGLLRRYGWIAVVVILGIVGAAAFNEYRKAQAVAAAQAFGDSIMTALEGDTSADRAAALQGLSTDNALSDAVLQFLVSGELAEDGDIAGATEALRGIAANNDVALMYRQLAQFKMLTLNKETMSADERRVGFEALAAPNVPLRLLAEEQIALIDVETGEVDAAIERFNAILNNEEATPGLQQRAVQVIVALGKEPDLGPLTDSQ
ncbi:MAG: hypothetical protein HRU30_00045 [Rhodobacteraceae bacterium]|nr:hypothetical protein [Paracoccaceae bacterium]